MDSTNFSMSNFSFKIWSLKIICSVRALLLPLRNACLSIFQVCFWVFLMLINFTTAKISQFLVDPTSNIKKYLPQVL